MTLGEKQRLNTDWKFEDIIQPTEELLNDQDPSIQQVF
jgi:hypothetical protein